MKYLEDSLDRILRSKFKTGLLGFVVLMTMMWGSFFIMGAIFPSDWQTMWYSAPTVLTIILFTIFTAVVTVIGITNADDRRERWDAAQERTLEALRRTYHS